MNVILTMVVSSNLHVRSMSFFNSTYFAHEMGFCSNPVNIKYEIDSFCDKMTVWKWILTYFCQWKHRMRPSAPKCFAFRFVLLTDEWNAMHPWCTHKMQIQIHRPISRQSQWRPALWWPIERSKCWKIRIFCPVDEHPTFDGMFEPMKICWSCHLPWLQPTQNSMAFDPVQTGFIRAENHYKLTIVWKENRK